MKKCFTIALALLAMLALPAGALAEGLIPENGATGKTGEAEIFSGAVDVPVDEAEEQ